MSKINCIEEWITDSGDEIFLKQNAFQRKIEVINQHLAQNDSIPTVEKIIYLTWNDETEHFPLTCRKDKKLFKGTVYIF